MAQVCKTAGCHKPGNYDNGHCRDCAEQIIRRRLQAATGGHPKSQRDRWRSKELEHETRLGIDDGGADPWQL